VPTLSIGPPIPLGALDRHRYDSRAGSGVSYLVRSGPLVAAGSGVSYLVRSGPLVAIGNSCAGRASHLLLTQLFRVVTRLQLSVFFLV
jgi:hypothetical protein